MSLPFPCLPVPTWYHTPERRVMLERAARAWAGTPFFPNSEAIGPNGGVDCVRLLLAIYTASGVMPRFELRRHFMDYGQHARESLLIAAFSSWPEVAPYFHELPDCSPANILPGDALCFRAGHVPHHAGLMVTRDEFIHALMPTGAHLTPLRAAIRGRRILGELVAVFRPLPESP